MFDNKFAVVSHEHHVQYYACILIVLGIIMFFAVCRNEEYQETEIKWNSFQLLGSIFHDELLDYLTTLF
jgi:uncharacterized membrane protein